VPTSMQNNQLGKFAPAIEMIGSHAVKASVDSRMAATIKRD